MLVLEGCFTILFSKLASPALFARTSGACEICNDHACFVGLTSVFYQHCQEILFYRSLLILFSTSAFSHAFHLSNSKLDSDINMVFFPCSLSSDNPNANVACFRAVPQMLLVVYRSVEQWRLCQTDLVRDTLATVAIILFPPCRWVKLHLFLNPVCGCVTLEGGFSYSGSPLFLWGRPSPLLVHSTWKPTRNKISQGCPSSLYAMCEFPTIYFVFGICWTVVFLDSCS